jgi:hypothetical protein
VSPRVWRPRWSRSAAQAANARLRALKTYLLASAQLQPAVRFRFVGFSAC